MVDAHDGPTAMSRRTHWNDAWSSRSPESVSWYQPTPEPSFGLVRSVTTPSDPIIDIGGGASALAGALVAAGYRDVSVLDVSGAALEALRARLAESATRVRTVEADVLEHAFEPAGIALWHDRAVFHFLTEPDDRARYRAQLDRAVRPGGHAVIGTFAEDGPTKCSGLPVERYDGKSLATALGAGWALVRAVRHEHRTPGGTVQPFTFVVARRLGA
jgi:SAM-dependent methyltransferase